MTMRTEYPSAERRRAPRNRVETDVYVGTAEGRRRVRARNLSRNGVFVEAADLDLAAGSALSLVFSVTVNGVIKLHHKEAVVVYVAAHGVGLRMQGQKSAPVGV